MEDGNLMNDKIGVVFGLANDRSYAWYISQALLAAGAQIIYAYYPTDKNERRFRQALEELGQESAEGYSCDVMNDQDLNRMFEQISQKHERIDFVVHSVAFANKDYLRAGTFHHTPRDVWNVALETSSYSLVAIAQRAKPLMTSGGSILALSYLGGEKVVPGYNVMGVAKAALEMSARYLAFELGSCGIRVNCISGGPLKTLSAMGIENFELLLDLHEKVAPLRRNITGEEAGKAAVFLLSDQSSGVTGEVLHVDAGFHILSHFGEKNQ